MAISQRNLRGFCFSFLSLVLIFSGMTACSSGSNTCSSYWVASNGNDSASGDSANPFLTLERAQSAVRSDENRGSCSIQVNIRAGTYRLSEPLVFSSQDSGAAGAPVVYQAAPGEEVIISGGQSLSGWQLVDAVNNIWQAQAQVSTSLMPRQLYVNGERATRARTPDYPNYYYRSDNGYTYLYLFGTDPQIPPVWENPSVVEAVTATQWKMMRCPVAEVQSSSEVIMQQPCWNNANVFPEPWNFQLLSWLENAVEFLDEPGEWYIDPNTQLVSYIPLAGQDMLSAEAELPLLETLLVASGDVSQAVSYLTFQGLTFSYATWLSPSSPDGYALDQSGFHLLGPNHEPNAIGHDQNVVRTPGNVSLLYAQNIIFQNNTFTHLGAVGLDFGTGSQNNQIINNTFSDISGAGIQLGGVDAQDHHPSDASQFTQDNIISNNLIEYIGQEFYDAPGIYIGFTTRSLVEHNDIQNVPWSGIAIGWGWGLLDPGGFAGLPHATPDEWGVFTTPSAAHQNQIVHNYIQNFLLELWDGGAIYSTGFQGTSMEDGQLIAWNVAENKRPSAGGNTFYTDGGSRYVTVEGNVSLNNPQGYLDFGPCLKASSFDTLCLSTDVIPYGQDMGGCIPYGDLIFQENYLRNPLDFYNICNNDYFPSNPVNMSITNNAKIFDAIAVPQWILDEAGRQ